MNRLVLAVTVFSCLLSQGALAANQCVGIYKTNPKAKYWLEAKPGREINLTFGESLQLLPPRGPAVKVRWVGATETRAIFFDEIKQRMLEIDREQLEAVTGQMVKIRPTIPNIRRQERIDCQSQALTVGLEMLLRSGRAKNPELIEALVRPEDFLDNTFYKILLHAQRWGFSMGTVSEKIIEIARGLKIPAKSAYRTARAIDFLERGGLVIIMKQIARTSELRVENLEYVEHLRSRPVDPDEAVSAHAVLAFGVMPVGEKHWWRGYSEAYVFILETRDGHVGFMKLSELKKATVVDPEAGRYILLGTTGGGRQSQLHTPSWSQ